MIRSWPKTLTLLLLLLGLGVLVVTGESTKPQAATVAKVDFTRDIRPVLADNCFACHGPDEKQRKAKLRLDTKEGAFAKLRGDGFAIVPGKSAESDLITRISSDDAAIHMPPAKSNKQLTSQQIELLRQWIDQGAPWAEHWAFVPPQRPAVPEVRGQKSDVRNSIDNFILARLEAEGLKPSPEADKAVLLRRVTLDLTGLPPTPAEIDVFLADTSPDAYEKVVDRLLQSPRFGEHMARYWLDAARYGDTHGLHLDNYREIWPYRDWVIKAFNDNKPFDRFIIEQLAGDMLPDATLEQIVATGFNRCHVTTNEGGSIEEEVYVRNVVDRVETTGVVFFGLTIGCARCHDHKYDPVTSKDFYQMFAFFNSIDGKDMDGNAAQHPPVVKVPTPEQATALARLDEKIAPIRKKIDEERAQINYDESADAKEPEEGPRAEYVWIDDAIPAGAKPSTAGGPNGPWQFVSKPDHPVHSGEKSHTRTADGLSQHFFEAAPKGLRVGDGDTLFAYVYLDAEKPPKEIMLQWFTDGWKHRAYWGENLIPWGAEGTPERVALGKLPETGKWIRLEVAANKVGIKPGMTIVGWAFTQHAGTVHWDKAGIVTRVPQADQPFDTLSAWLRAQRATGGAGLPKEIQDLVKLDKSKRTEQQQKQLVDYFVERAYAKTRGTFEPLLKEIVAVEKERDQLDKQVPTTLVFKESSQPKPAYMLKRGEYDRKGDQVGRATPAFLPPMPETLPRNRLGFAQWLVAPSHPLTTRVAVNRFWQQCFGTGLVKTTEDFGTQGEPPSHPELLDWLATEFMASGGRESPGWDVKKLMRLIVTSATYRQSSKITKDRLAKDPANRLLSRGPRYRLDAEVLRDQALAASGLLVEKIGGPGVKPPQPYGLWEAVGYLTSNTRNFVADTGHDKIHRRSLYTFWKRTAPPPQMNIFDAPSRETCRVRRERTNTPLQALLLLNDKQYVECARALAERTMKEAGDKPEARAAHMFRLATARKPDAAELTELLAVYNDLLARYNREVESAKKLIAIGETKPDANLSASELAAWTMVANLILNLDEVLNKG